MEYKAQVAYLAILNNESQDISVIFNWLLEADINKIAARDKQERSSIAAATQVAKEEEELVDDLELIRLHEETM